MIKTIIFCYVLSIEKHSFVNKKNIIMLMERVGKIFVSSDLFWAAERSFDKSAV